MSDRAARRFRRSSPPTGSYEHLVGKGGTSPAYAGYSLDTSANGAQSTGCTRDGVIAGDVCHRAPLPADGRSGERWMYVALVVQSGPERMLTILFDGAVAETGVAAPIAPNDEPLTFGGRVAGDGLSGTLDEVRIGPWRSTDWLRYEERNQRAPATSVRLVGSMP